MGHERLADHYDIGLASVHGAIAFYYDNEAAINESSRAAREPGDKLGARSAQTVLDEIKRRGDAS